MLFRSALAQRFEVNDIAVWINVPLERALQQNAKRAPDEVVPEVALRSVFGLIEIPTLEEGFLEVIEVKARHAKAAQCRVVRG